MSEPVLAPEDREGCSCNLDGSLISHAPDCSDAASSEAFVVLSASSLARHRVVAAEAARAELVARVLALADDFDGVYGQRVARRLRALVVPAHAGPTGDTTHERKQP